jgi:hypothetical protein
MDNLALIQRINDGTATCGSANDSEKAQIIEACNKLISSLEPLDQKLMDLIFSVSIIAVKSTRINYSSSAGETNSTSSWN